jgi:hypothetical protein
MKSHKCSRPRRANRVRRCRGRTPRALQLWPVVRLAHGCRSRCWTDLDRRRARRLCQNDAQLLLFAIGYALFASFQTDQWPQKGSPAEAGLRMPGALRPTGRMNAITALRDSLAAVCRAPHTVERGASSQWPAHRHPVPRVRAISAAVSDLQTQGCHGDLLSCAAEEQPSRLFAAEGYLSCATTVCIMLRTDRSD